VIAITNIQVKAILEEFNEIADNTQNLAIFTRDIELQKSAVQTIADYIARIDLLLEESQLPESELNLLLFLKFTIEAVKLELHMIICLKENQMDTAWASLIQAQGSISIAAANHPFNHESLDGFIARLESFEKLLFPKMMFASVGGIINRTKCSICGLEYEECNHMKGKFYSGKLCVREVHEMELEEISMVENPASKLNRQLGTTYDGKEVNVLTLI
jgi:hypothetical protein